MDTTRADLCTLFGIPQHPRLSLGIPADPTVPFVPTRQTSSSGRPKSPRIQVVLPEELCERLATLAEAEARTVSNMARVLIQQGVERLEQQLQPTDRFRAALEQQQARPQRLRGAPRRLRLRPPR